jgi:hypothetical protein
MRFWSAALVTVAVLSAPMGFGQATPAANKDADAIAAIKERVNLLRDTFVAATVAAGYKCAISPPTIVVASIFSYGNYDEATNTLTTSAWELLTPEEKARFYRLAGADATDDSARQQFEIGVHHWVFVHELGHWWQTCRHVANEDHYLYESGANRIATAYWREHNRDILVAQRTTFDYVLTRVPDPVPEGESVESYFNSHYPDKFKSGPEYTWFQARMCLRVFDEHPAPSFADVLRQTGR